MIQGNKFLTFCLRPDDQTMKSLVRLHYHLETLTETRFCIMSLWMRPDVAAMSQLVIRDTTFMTVTLKANGQIISIA